MIYIAWLVLFVLFFFSFFSSKIPILVPITIYALDDNSALKIINDKIEVISEGEWFVINEKE